MVTASVLVVRRCGASILQRCGASDGKWGANNVTANISELIYDWNTIYARSMVPAGRVLLNDESLRDGLQSPSVRDPSIEEKIEILHLMEGVGINMLDIGLPGAGPRARRTAKLWRVRLAAPR